MTQTTPGFREHVGLETHGEGPGRATVRLRARDEHLNSAGTVHGGVVATLIDSATGTAVRTAAEGADARPATIGRTVTYLGPGSSGDIPVTAQVRERGKRITSWRRRPSRTAT